MKSTLSVFVLSLLFISYSTAADRKVPQRLQTTAEQSNYKATTRHKDVEKLLRRFAKLSPRIQLQTFGRTVENRPLLVAITGQGVKEPKDVKPDHLVVLLLGNIHSGECAGKESLLMLLREMATQADHPLFKKLVLLMVPNYNADGNERVGKLHRPGQIGPVAGMGRRENAQQLDLNRDFIKLDSPEARALVNLANRWSPHAFIDLHTTNGSQHRYALTYDVAHNPAVPPGPVRLLRNKILPEVTRRLEKKKIDTFYYGNFDAKHTRWSTFGHQPRYSTEYMGMRGSLAILSEAYSYISFRRRITATGQFVRECLTAFQRHSGAVRKTVATARSSNPPPMWQLSIRAKLARFSQAVVVKGYQTKGGKRTARDYSVEFWGKFVPTRQVNVPFAYVIPFDQSRAVDRLRMHGIRIHQLKKSTTAKLEIATKLVIRRGRPFQRHRLASIESKTKSVNQRIPAGSYIVPLNQSLSRLIVYLLEPSSDDGLAKWNFFDHVLKQGGRYPVARLLGRTKLDLSAAITKVRPAEKIEFDHVYGSRRVPFSGAFSLVSWERNSAKYRRTWAGRSVLVDAETGSMEAVKSRQPLIRALAKLPGMKRNQAARLARSRFVTKPDGTLLLLGRSGLFHIDLKAGKAKRLAQSKGRKRFPTASPDGKMVAFVRNHNLWVVDVGTGKERPLTKLGDATHFFGELDWVYQEEVYGRGNYKAFWWSPDSKHIALLKLDETPVRKYTVADQIPVRQSLRVTTYPKSGDPLPKVALGVVPAGGGAIHWIKDKAYEKLKDLLIVRVAWRPDGSKVVYQVQNREQTWLDLREMAMPGGSSTRILRETSRAWVSVLGQPRWLKDGSFLWLSERAGTRQLYRVADGKTQQLTSTSGDVASIAAIDPKQEWVYFHAYDHSSIAQQVYRLRLRDRHTERISKHEGHHVGRFNRDCTHWIAYRSSVHQPVKVELVRNNGEFVRSLAPNLTDHLQYCAVQKPQRVRVPTRDNDHLDAMLIRPANFDPKKKYPVLCYVYSGPQAPTVQNRWSGSTYLWHQMLAQKGYCIWLCDNRSASRRGANKAWPIHRQMGKQELADIEDGLKWLKSKPWIDGRRIGIWGWSYGGYMTAYALTHSTSFKAGIAGAPVTDWRNYDAIYTERYMGLPEKNKSGYQVSSVVAAAKNLSGRLLLIHGTQDDNVHLSNTLQLVYALQNAGKRFDLMVYPKNRHGIGRPNQFRHLRKLMTRFVLEEL